MVEKKEKESKSMPFPDGVLKQGSNGSMNYDSKQEGFEKSDSAKVKRGSFKDGRYS